MNDPLTIQGLLKKLDKTRINAEILARCHEAEQVSHRRNFPKAIGMAQVVVKMATRANTASKASVLDESIRRTTAGLAFLYQAIVRSYSDDKAEREKAELDGDVALTWLNLDDHHRVIARLIQATIVFNNGKRDSAIDHYLEARSLLDDLIDEHHRTGNREQEDGYARLRRTLDERVNRIRLGELAQSIRPSSDRPFAQSGEPSSADSSPTSSQQPPATEQLPIVLPVPTELLWPDHEPIRVRVASIAEAPDILGTKPTAGSATLEQIEINQLTISGQQYAVQSTNHTDSFRLKTDQNYLPLRVVETHRAQGRTQADYVLVQEQDHIEQLDQLLVIMATRTRRVWVIHKGISGSDAQPPTIIGERNWTFMDGSETVSIAEKDAHIIGVVVALLTRRDEMNQAPLLESDPSDAQVPPIIPGETLFNPREGHVAVDCGANRDLKEGIILEVVSDHRADHGPAEVIVNRYDC